MKLTKTRTIVAGAVVSLALLGAACGSDDGNGSNASSATTQAAAATTMPMASETIVDIAAGNPDFSTLVTAVQAADLASTLSGPGPYTVFAPTNEAFAKLPAGTLDTLLEPANQQQLTDILTYHVVSGEVMAADVEPGPVTTVEGGTFTVSTDGGKVVITDAKGNKVNVVTTDIVASNGVIHVIDGILMP